AVHDVAQGRDYSKTAGQAPVVGAGSADFLEEAPTLLVGLPPTLTFHFDGGLRGKTTGGNGRSRVGWNACYHQPCGLAHALQCPRQRQRWTEGRDLEITFLGTGSPMAPERCATGLLVTAPGCEPLLIGTCGGFELPRQLARIGQPIG